ncbi:MAG: sensor histidine kinase [Clostridiales bacterium]|nr:sensor histidine kinase [Clostridiales bacterium]
MRIFDVIDDRDAGGDKEPERKSGKFKKIFNRIYMRLFMIIIVFSVVPCLVINLWTNYYINNVVFEYYLEEYLDSIYGDIQSILNNYIDQISSYSSSVISDGRIYSIYEDAALTNQQKEEKIREYINLYQKPGDLVANIDIVVDDNFKFRQYPVEMTELSSSYKSKITHTNILIASDIASDASGGKYIVFGRQGYSMYKNKRLFDLYLYVPEEKIYNAISELNGNDNLIFITAGDKVVCHPDKSILGRYMFSPMPSYDDAAVNRRNGGNYFYGSKKIDLKIASEDVWKIESKMSYSWFNRIADRFKDETEMLVAVSIVISLLAAMFIPISLLKSMSILKRRMADFAKGKSEGVMYDENSFSEIYALEESFNRMIVEINSLIQKNNIEKEKQKRAELRALQAQINPHFIYNALDSISWSAKLAGESYLSEMVQQLANFFRISLHKGDTFITVKEEISHIESYSAIEQMRFPKLFEINYKIQDDILDKKILKIVLQPIVENAIKHGFENMDTGGIINITGYSDENDDLIFEVEDNGCGFLASASVLERNKGGYGLYNVNERIRLEYGDEYGISLRSVPGEGTTVKIRLR